jgi:CRP/FNR family cyclic AMP-dependent transcriptional regulator
VLRRRGRAGPDFHIRRRVSRSLRRRATEAAALRRSGTRALARALASAAPIDYHSTCLVPERPILLSILDLCHALPVRSFEPGVVLLTEGERSGLLYVLIDGEVEILKGDFQIAIVADPGAIFGEISALLDIPHMATVRTVTPCRAHVVAGGDAFLRSHTEVAYQLSKLLAQRLHGLTTYLVDLKRQFEHHDDHFSMVDDILETLVHQQRHSFTPGSDRDPDV